MGKLKTRSSASKRYKRTSLNKIKRRKAFKSHILTKKTRKRKKRLSKNVVVCKVDTKNIKRMLIF
uniref:ribosomal protein L35 n=1 Tax=Haramonas pauciplastida TaxID=478668 RepID=UPI002115B1DA|nr:ribosomal protein L35 [Haramonas pauciplastida]UTE94927.1 ribosomal protein L35 [Haramonas pauciplastida]